MKNRFNSFLGHASAVLTTGAFIPGVISVWGLKPAPATAISIPMYIILSVGLAGWLAYGIRTKSWPVTIANAITLPLALSILVYKAIYG